MLIFVNDAAEAVTSADVEMRDHVWFQINMRSSSSRRQLWIHRSITVFIRGIRTPLRTTVIPASARIASNSAGYLPSRSRIRYRAFGPDVLQVHDQVAGDLGDPGGGRVRGGAQDPYPPGGVLDDGQDVHPCAGQGHRLEEVSREAMPRSVV